MLTLIDTAAFYTAGLLSWSGLEYGIHRFIGHEGKISEYGYDLHQHHHRYPQGEGYTPGAPAWDGAGYLDGLKRMGPLAAQVMGGLNLAFVPVLGLRRAAALSAGILTGWVRYEKLHMDIHQRPPENAWEQWAWKHHMAHHFKNPKMNHSVSTDFWDKLFGTLLPVEDVGVPLVLAPPWLIEKDHPGFRIKGKRPAAADADTPATAKPKPRRRKKAA